MPCATSFDTVSPGGAAAATVDGPRKGALPAATTRASTHATRRFTRRLLRAVISTLPRRSLHRYASERCGKARDHHRSLARVDGHRRQTLLGRPRVRAAAATRELAERDDEDPDGEKPPSPRARGRRDGDADDQDRPVVRSPRAAPRRDGRVRDPD